METALENDLYHLILESPLKVRGVEIALPGLKKILRELRRDKFSPKSRSFRVTEEHMIRAAWARYREDLRQLRERLQKDQKDDELLSWLVLFLIEHYRELARLSIAAEAVFASASAYGEAAEDSLIVLESWHEWAVEWINNALREESDPLIQCRTQETADDGGGHEGHELFEPGNKPQHRGLGFEF